MDGRWARILAVGLLAALVGGPVAAAPPRGEPSSHSYIVHFRSSADPVERASVLSAAGATQTDEIGAFDLVEITVAATSIPLLRAEPAVRWIEREGRLYTSAAPRPNDPLLSRQWPLRKLGAFRGWRAEKGTAGEVIVAVVDTGVDPSHPDLKNRLVDGLDFVGTDDDPADDDGHGTHVAGIIAAQPNNRKGIAGLSWGARIMPVKACNEEGACGYFEVAAAIAYALARDVDVVNLSLGAVDTGCPAPFELMGRAAATKGVLLVASAGNEGQNGNPTSYPAACEGYVGVGATTARDGWAKFSQYHDYVDLSAPGEFIFSTIPPALGGLIDDPATPGYGPASGTSMAAPHVAGLAALLLAQNPDWTPAQVQQRMEETAVDLGPRGRDAKFGEGRISVVRALRAEGASAP